MLHNSNVNGRGNFVCINIEPAMAENVVHGWTLKQPIEYIHRETGGPIVMNLCTVWM